MEYMVRSISPSLTEAGDKTIVANQIQEVIQKFTDEGWEYVGIEHLSTYVHGSKGCFGFGATPGRNITVQLIIFRR